MVPPTLAETGDIIFERSRAKAQAALEKLQLDLNRRSTAEELVQTIHEIRTGARVSSISLDDMGARWNALPRRRPLSASYIKQTESWTTRFVKFVKDFNQAIHEMAQVQSTVCRSFLKAEASRGEVRGTLVGKMPALLGGGQKAEPPDNLQLRAKLTAREPTTWRQIRDELLARLSPESEKTIPTEVVQVAEPALVA